jgi:hypothetical protein
MAIVTFIALALGWGIAARGQPAESSLKDFTIVPLLGGTPIPTKFSKLICTTSANEIEIRNGHYLARISRAATGMSVMRLKPDVAPDAVAYAGDAIELGLRSPLPPTVTDAQLTEVQASVEKCYGFYARVSVTGRLVFQNLASFLVKRTYEFTRSSNIYAQLEIRLERAYGPVRVVPEDSVQLQSLIWTFSTDSRAKVFATTNDLIVQVPDGPLGGLNDGLFGHHARSFLLESGTAGNWLRPVLLDGQLADGYSTVLRGRTVLLSNCVVAIDATAPLDFASDQYRSYQLYPTFGMHTYDEKGEARNHQNTNRYYFNKWNDYKYAMENVIPISPSEENRQTEDALIRHTMFLIERLALDQGWWKHFPTEISGRFYPRGDRAATNSRSFPALAYVWAYLTMRRTPQGWVRVPGDADVIYHELQKIYPFYLISDPAPNLADQTPAGIPYIAYSSHHRERLGRPDESKRVINVHGQALHFAWLMQEASRLYGDPIREQQWAEVVARYHQGSKTLFSALYPGQDLADPPRTYSGLIGYSLPLREAKMAYVSITFEGLPAGYLDAGEYEPEFADVVERASRQDTVPLPCRGAQEEERADRCNEDGTDKRASWPYASYAWRVIRAFPAALAFSRSEELNEGNCIPPSAYPSWGSFMSRDLSTASLMEVLAYDRAQENECLQSVNGFRCIHHDRAKFISEGNGRKWILTNSRFQSYWSPGFWEEVRPRDVPENARFAVRFTAPPPPRQCTGEHYSAYRAGNRIFVMTDYSGGTLTLELPGNQLARGISQLSVTRRTYDQNTGRWNPEQAAAGVVISSGSGGKILVQLQQVQRKALTIVEIQP